MTIYDKRTTSQPMFYTLEPGDTFECKGDMYMKIEAIRDEYHMKKNAINLRTTCLEYFQENTAVFEVDAELNIT